MIVHVSKIAKRRRMKIASNNLTMFSLFYLLTFCKRRARSEQVSVNTYMYACILHMRQNFLAIFANGSSNSRWWRRKHLKKEANFTEKWGKTSNDTETWKNALPKDSSRAPISDGQGNVFQGMVSEKKRKKWGELWKKCINFAHFKSLFLYC